MKIGVVSDTHDNMPNVARIVDLFNAAGVEFVIHTGDITMARTLDVMAGLTAPMMGVFGNNDTLREGLANACARHGFRFDDPPLTLSLGGREIVVVMGVGFVGAVMAAIVADTEDRWSEWGDQPMRLTRVVVYEGPASWLREQIARSLPEGVRACGHNRTVTVYIDPLGPVPVKPT